MDNKIKIPIFDNSRKEVGQIIFYPDELPEDSSLICDVLRAGYAPLKVWRACAVEYYRQGCHDQFEMLLKEIVQALDTKEIRLLYHEHEKDEFSEGITEILTALAAKALSDLSKARAVSTAEQSFEYSKKCVELLKKADENQRINEYTWIIKGFYELIQGELKRADDQFRAVHERATKGQNISKKKYLFGSVVGLGVVSYAQQRYEQALDYFVRATQINPTASGATVRMAIALCCFQLEQYDRARLALGKCISMSPTDANILVMFALLDQVTAKKDRSKRLELRNTSFEYSMLAHSVDPTNALALNLLANHHFHSWETILFDSAAATSASTMNNCLDASNSENRCCYILTTTHLLVPAAAAKGLIVSRNQLKINSSAASNSKIYTIKQVYGTFNNFENCAEEALHRFAGLFPNISEASLAEFVVVELTAGSSPASSTNSNSSNITNCIPITRLEVKDLVNVEKLAKQAMLCTVLPAVWAESNYLLGKVAHTLRDQTSAFDYYFKALRDSPEMVLAAFGAAQILLSRKEFSHSLELFEKVLTKNPDDKDTQAYVMLLKAINRDEIAPFDKLREIAPGFQHEAQLWLVQGAIRQKDANEHKNALKCFLNAKECLEQNQQQLDSAFHATDRETATATTSQTIPVELLSNIAVLYHSAGQLSKALDYSRQSLAVFQSSQQQQHSTTNAAARQFNPVFRSSELEGIFYEWNDSPVCRLRIVDNKTVVVVATDSDDGAVCQDDEIRFVVCSNNADKTTTVADSTFSLNQFVAPGDEVMIGGILHTVQRVLSATEMICTSPVKLTLLLLLRSNIGSSRDDDATTTVVQFEMKTKLPLNNFVEESVTYCYNLARLMEDLGNTRAAVEIYVELLKKHPSFIECYLRLSLISCDMGKYSEAQSWLARALYVKEDEPEATMCLGDLYARSSHSSSNSSSTTVGGSEGKPEDAKKCYDKICSAYKHDSRPMLSLGNFYYAFSEQQQQQLKESYKFFYHVLHENPHNAYAANGLGMVCVEKKEIDIAREMFSKAREANVSVSEDICTNLAHVYVQQNRLLDAERLYQATNRNLARTARSVDKSAYLNECTAYAQYRHGRHEEAIRSLLRAIHLNPTHLRFWYNIAYVGESQSMITFDKYSSSSAQQQQLPVGSASIIEDAMQGAVLSKKTFRHLSSSSLIQQPQQQKPYERKLAGAHYASCSERIKVLAQLLHSARKDEMRQQEERRRQEEEHNARMRSKHEQKEKEALAQDQEKLQKQQLAGEKERKLQELREKWTSSSSSSNVAAMDGSASSGGTGRQKSSSVGQATSAAKKRRRSSAAAVATDEDGRGTIALAALDDEEDEALMRSLHNNKNQQQGNIDFGSSSEEDNDDADDNDDSEQEGGGLLRTSIGRAAKRKVAAASTTVKDDLFGDDSDDDLDAVTSVRAAQTSQRKRLKKNISGNHKEDNDSSDDEPSTSGLAAENNSEQIGIDNSSSSSTVTLPVQRKQVIIDDDDDGAEEENGMLSME